MAVFRSHDHCDGALRTASVTIPGFTERGDLRVHGSRMDFTCSSEDGVTPSAFPQQLRFREQRLKGPHREFLFHPGSN